jgi:TRAP-type C4-dicarboxylate transport system permease small subunit
MDNKYGHAMAVITVFMGMLLIAGVWQGVRDFRKNKTAEATLARQTPRLFWFGAVVGAGCGIAFIVLAIQFWLRP